MSAGSTPYESPYTPTPGGATPSPTVTPEEGISDMKVFFWLAISSAAIIGGAGVIAWWFATGR